MRQLTRHTFDTPFPVGPVHAYTFEHDGGIVVIDTGPRTDEAKNYWRSAIDLGRVSHVLITHCHVDHYGLLDLFEDETDAVILMSRYDVEKFERYPERLAMLGELFRGYGFPEEGVRMMGTVMDGFAKSVPFPKRVSVLEDAEREMRSIGVSHSRCPGHSQSDIVYLVDDHAVSGDVMLDGIFQTPLLDADVDTFAGRFRNYDAYCDTIGTLAGLGGYAFAPGHRDFLGIEAHLGFYVAKLVERASPLQGRAGRSVFQNVRDLLGESIFDHPFRTYVKACEMVFFGDFLDAPERLLGALETAGFTRAAEPVRGFMGQQSRS